MPGFNGFEKDTYVFLMELGFNNDRAFFDANRERCRRVVQTPMKALAAELIPTALDIDPAFNTRMTTLVSRMNRDTRFSKNKLPYRDHAWIGFKHIDERTSESFCMYVEVEPEGYGYGMGMYGANPKLMKPYRERAIADPAKLVALSAGLTERGFRIEGDMYKRDRFPSAPEELKPLINRNGISWCYFSEKPSRTFDASFKDEVIDAMLTMKPLYRFVCGTQQSSDKA